MKQVVVETSGGLGTSNEARLLKIKDSTGWLATREPTGVKGFWCAIAPKLFFDIGRGGFLAN